MLLTQDNMIEFIFTEINRFLNKKYHFKKSEKRYQTYIYFYMIRCFTCLSTHLLSGRLIFYQTKTIQ